MRESHKTDDLKSNRRLKVCKSCKAGAKTTDEDARDNQPGDAVFA